MENIRGQGVPRRAFLAASLASAAVAGVSVLGGTAGVESQPAGDAEVYELRLYAMKTAKMTQRAHGYFQNALIPALRRSGTGPVGVFSESAKPEVSPIYVLIPHAAIGAVVAVRAALQNDAEYQKAGADFLGASPKDPAYGNLEVRIMAAPDFMPHLKTLEKTDGRSFELRRYRNPSEPAFYKKLEMFGKGGELAAFGRSGLTPVFFGGMISGPDMPNITYMLTYPDGGSHDKAWNAFGHDEGWQKLRSTPGYTDAEIIADIKSIMLNPTAYSQI